ncbi:hypothetical protein NCAS_0A04800 [Naumovozyma castellii]|uniref:C2H2-type domain-containing protein n=1 Tax=Naumovozyma castellii TaxID=27288 RepID=G0V6E6_NAUCA|nr:hypothetical protein NCAS_0A04800 [Naumovozyma castellii CBS 4309]CCC67038.1 hypothetical protein NCAS_0A04800 [Naumovozyma castellii CBS 4309]
MMKHYYNNQLLPNQNDIDNIDDTEILNTAPGVVAGPVEFIPFNTQPDNNNISNVSEGTSWTRSAPPPQQQQPPPAYHQKKASNDTFQQNYPFPPQQQHVYMQPFPPQQQGMNASAYPPPPENNTSNNNIHYFEMDPNTSNNNNSINNPSFVMGDGYMVPRWLPVTSPQSGNTLDRNISSTSLRRLMYTSSSGSSTQLNQIPFIQQELDNIQSPNTDTNNNTNAFTTTNKQIPNSNTNKYRTYSEMTFHMMPPGSQQAPNFQLVGTAGPTTNEEDPIEAPQPLPPWFMYNNSSTANKNVTVFAPDQMTAPDMTTTPQLAEYNDPTTATLSPPTSSLNYLPPKSAPPMTNNAMREFHQHISMTGASGPFMASSSSSSSFSVERDTPSVYQCHMCVKSFRRHSWLKRHLLAHSSQRHYSCPKCVSKHKRKDNLLQHLKLKHTAFVLEQLRQDNIDIKTAKDEGEEDQGTASNTNIKTLLVEGRLNKEDVKKVLNRLIDSANQEQQPASLKEESE